jgi:tetratricopeptide (TPR) repeat protein
MAQGERRGIPRDYLIGATSLSKAQSLYRADPAGGVRILDAALAEHPLSSMPALDRPYPLLATAYAIAGEPARARQLMKEYATLVPTGLQRQNHNRHMAAGYIALAEGRSQDAIAAFRTWWDESECTNCALPDLGRAYDQAGQADSALATYQRAATNPGDLNATWQDQFNLHHTYRRLGELYEREIGITRSSTTAGSRRSGRTPIRNCSLRYGRSRIGWQSSLASRPGSSHG